MYPKGEYDAQDDFARSLDVCYATIRARMAAGGPPWRPKVNNDQNPPSFNPAPFPPQLPSEHPPLVEQPGPKKRGGRRGPRASKPAKRGLPKGSRKIDKEIKKARTRQAATQTMAQATAADTGLKVSFAAALSIVRDLDPPEVEVLQKCILALAGCYNKKSRERVTTALTKVVLM